MKANRLARFMPLLFVSLLMLLASGCQYILPAEEEPLPPPLAVPKDVVYTTVDVQRGDMVNSVQGIGRIESVRMVDLYYEAGGGRIKSVNVKVGDTVKKGDVLLELTTDDVEYNLMVERLRLKQLENTYAASKRYMDKMSQRNTEIDLQIKRLDIKRLEEQKENALLRSPIDGSVVYVTAVNQGNWVDAYSTLVRIADQNVKMLTYSDDLNRSSFQIGMKVRVEMKDKSVVEGEIVSTPFERSKFDPESLSRLIFIKIPDEAIQNAKVGEEAKVVLVLAERKGVLKLPRNVVRTYLQRKYVQVVEDGIKVEKDIQTGLETPTEVEILSGLAEGEKVIR